MKQGGKRGRLFDMRAKPVVTKRLRGLVLILAAMLLLPGGALAAGSAQRLVKRGQVTAQPPVAERGTHPALPPSIPSPGHDAQLYTNTCVSRSDCWAVGFRGTSTSTTLNQALHWTGKKWREASVPQPVRTAGGNRSYLEWVACTSASNCWAVGYYNNSADAELNEALRWNGKRWKLVKTPQPGKTSGSEDQSYLYGVSCASVSDCWAVGAYTNASGATLNQALRWNGEKWSRVSTPQPAGTRSGRQNTLYSVTCTSASNCWAPGVRGPHLMSSTVNEMLDWNGKRWRSVKVPKPGGTGASANQYIEQVACTGASRCWGIGAYQRPSTDAEANAVIRWNGKKWTLAKTPQPAGSASGARNYLWGIDCTAASNCWAVGDYTNPVGATLNEALRWDGKKWKLVKTPQPGGTTLSEEQNVLYSVSCVSSSFCSAIGYVRNTADQDLNQALRWNGRRWKKN